MKIQKVIRAQGNFAKKGVDVKPGDVVTIKSEGQWLPGQHKDQFVVKIENNGEEYNVNFNQTNLNILHDEFGDDTVKWIGKEVVARARKDTIAGKKVEIYYYVTPEWNFDDYGELIKGIQTEEVDVADIPF
jgi:ribosomal 50S subunit-recycling heat shock protein